MISLLLFYLAVVLAFIITAVYVALVVSAAYAFYLIFYASKTYAYTTEVNGASAVDQYALLLTTSLTQAGAVIYSSISQIANIILQQLPYLFNFIMIMLLLLIPSIVWIEYHDVILSMLHSAYTCVITPFMFSFVYLFASLAVFAYNLIWPIWNALSEIVRFFTRELPITLLMCSAFSIFDALSRLKYIFTAFANDTISFFTSTPTPLSTGIVNYTATFTEIGAFTYYIAFGTTQCACSSGSVVWDFLFSWLFTSNPYNSLLTTSKKRSIFESSQSVIIPNAPIASESKIGVLLSDIIALALEPFQLIIRSLTQQNGPILPYKNGSIYYSNTNITIAKVSGDVVLDDLSDKMTSLTYDAIMADYLANDNVQNTVGFILINGTNYTYNVSVFPQDPDLGYFPNLKPLSEKLKKVLLDITELLDYQLYALYYVFMFFVNGASAPSQQVLDLFPPENKTTVLAARILCLIPDAVEFLFNLVMGLVSGRMLSCDKRVARIYLDTGGASSFYYSSQSSFNATHISSDSKEAVKLRFFGTLTLVMHDVGRIFGYIHPYLGEFVKGFLLAITNLISGTYNMVWRTILHIIDTEYKMFKNGQPANGKALSKDFVPSPNVYPPFSISSSNCGNSAFQNITQTKGGLFFVFLQDNYREIAGVHKTLLYGIYKSWRALQNTFNLLNTDTGQWVFDFLYLINSSYDGLVQGLVHVNIIFFTESSVQASLFIAEWKFNALPGQIKLIGQRTSDAIITLDPNGCFNQSLYSKNDINFVCAWALTTLSFFSIFEAINQQIVFLFTGFLTQQKNIPDFIGAINITEYMARNLTMMVVDGIVPPVLINTNGKTLTDAINPLATSLVSCIFILLTVSNYVVVKIAKTVVDVLYIGTPQNAFAAFATVLGSILQYTGDEIINRFGYGLFVELGVFLDTIFNAVPGIFAPLFSNIVLIIDIIRNSFTVFAIKLLSLLFAVLGRFIAIFFDSTDSMDVKISNFFVALGDFLLFIIVQAPLFLLNFLIGLLNVILPPPLNIIIVTILKLLIIGLCSLIQFFIDAVSYIINVFGGSVTPVNLCCNGGCTKKKRTFFGSNSTTEDSESNKDPVRQTCDLILKEFMPFGMTKGGSPYGPSFFGQGYNFFLSDRFSSENKKTVRTVPFLTENGPKNDSMFDSESTFLYSYPKKQLMERFNMISNAYKVIMNNRMKSKDEYQKKVDEIMYDVDTIEYMNSFFNAEKMDNFEVKIDECIIDSQTSDYIDNERVCLNTKKVSSSYESINMNERKRNIGQNDTQNTTTELFLTLDEGLVFIAHMVSWNGSTGCDTFMNNFVTKNLTIANFTILEEIYLKDCVTKRAIAEILNVFPQFRWIPTDLLYNPFAVVTVVFDAVRAYETYAQYQRDKVVPRSVFLSDPYKQSWIDMGLNTSYMSEENYETVMLNYTLLDYFIMNNANPAFIDAITDGTNMVTNNAKSIWANIINVSSSYQTSPVQYLDNVFEAYLKDIAVNDTNATDLWGNTYTTDQIATMEIWKLFLQTLASATATVFTDTTNQLKKRNFFGNIGQIFETINPWKNTTPSKKMGIIFSEWNEKILVQDTFTKYFAGIEDPKLNEYSQARPIREYIQMDVPMSTLECKRFMILLCESRHARIVNNVTDISIYSIEHVITDVSTIHTEFNDLINTCVQSRLLEKTKGYSSLKASLLYTYYNVQQNVYTKVPQVQLLTKTLVNNVMSKWHSHVVSKSALLTFMTNVYMPFGNTIKTLGNDMSTVFGIKTYENDHVVVTPLLKKRNIQNLSTDYPCVPQILGECTNCLFLDSTFSLFYQIGTRLIDNYTLTNNNSFLSQNVQNWNTRMSCLIYGENYRDPLCGCKTSYFDSGIYAINNLPGQTNKFAFPSTLKILPGDYGNGTLFDVLKGDATESLSNYFSNLFGVSSTASISVKLFAAKSYFTSSIMNIIATQTGQSTIYRQQNTISSDSNTQLGGDSVSMFDVKHYPTLYTSISMDGNIPIEILKRNPLSMCEIWILTFHGGYEVSSGILASICEIYGWPSIGISANTNLSQPIEISAKTNPISNYIFLKASISNGDQAISLAAYVAQLYSQYQTYVNSNITNILEFSTTDVFVANRSTSYFKSNAVDLTYLIFYLIKIDVITYVIDAIGAIFASIAGTIQNPATIFGSNFDNNTVISNLPQTSSTSKRHMFIFHPPTPTTYITSLSMTMPSYDNLVDSASEAVGYQNVNENHVGTFSTISIIYQTIIMANYDYDCATYRRCSLLEGIFIISIVYVFLFIGIALASQATGLSVLTSMIIQFIFMSTWWISVLVYTYNYPLLNLFPFAVFPPCLSDDIYELASCKLIGKCPQVFYGFTESLNFTESNCASCPSTLKFSNCKYTYGFTDFIDIILFLAKWLTPSLFSSLVASGLDDTSSGIFSILKTIFPFSYILKSDYFNKKLDTFTTLNMSDINTFDPYTSCFVTMGFAFTPSASIVFSAIAGGVFVVGLLLYALFSILSAIVLAYIYWMHAIMRTILINYVYTITPLDEEAIKKIILRELKKRIPKHKLKNDNDLEMSQVASAKRKPVDFNENTWTSNVYNRLWWRKTKSQKRNKGADNVESARSKLYTSFWGGNDFKGVWKVNNIKDAVKRQSNSKSSKSFWKKNYKMD